MAVGEAPVAARCQTPILPRPSAPFTLIVALDEARRFELEEVLTRAGRGDVEARADTGGGLWAARLQLEQDAILAAGVVLTHGHILETRCYLK